MKRTCDLEVFLPEHVDERGLSDVRDADDENVGLWIGRAVVPVRRLDELDRSGNYLKIPLNPISLELQKLIYSGYVGRK